MGSSRSRGGVVVTGAARGIGRAIAARFAEEGHPVVGVDLDGDALREAMSALPHGTAVEGDAGDEAVLKRACDLAAGDEGMHAFVANAGVARAGDSLDYPIELWDRLMGVHVTAAFLGARTACPRLRTGGSVTMISSVSGHLGFGGRAAYCAAKAGVQGLVRALAVEWAPRGVRVNAVSPGTIATDLQAEFIAKGVVDEKGYLAEIPMDRFGRPEEIADAVFYLSSQRASYVTGVTLPVDGGWLARGLPAPAEYA